MRFFLEFLHQPVPKAGKEIPAYYRRALYASDLLLAVYFLVCFFFFPLFSDRWHWMPLAMAAAAAIGIPSLKKMGVRGNLLLFTAMCVVWVSWNVSALGWSTGTQHFLTLILVLVFFNVYDKPVTKILWFLALLAFRVALFSWAQAHPVPDAMKMSDNANTVYQTINTVSFFTMLAALCVTFSTNIQDTERQLRLRNQALYKEAGTDPLTGLPNRRAMIETIERFRKVNPDQPFSVAIADIDFFKKVNDTYGHNCGDYTLVKLTELFREHSAGQYSACRWGGEEFCFFMPEKNVDEAGVIMNDLCFAVQRMPLHFEDIDFSITITIGVEECDFSSPMEELLKKADEKLYMGKEAGRNRVVV